MIEITEADAAVKPTPSLFFWAGVLPVVRVAMHGAKKYAPHAWRQVRREKFVEALQRHTIEFADRYPDEGVLVCDEESHLPIIAHIAANCLILLGHPETRAQQAGTL